MKSRGQFPGLTLHAAEASEIPTPTYATCNDYSASAIACLGRAGRFSELSACIVDEIA